MKFQANSWDIPCILPPRHMCSRGCTYVRVCAIACTPIIPRHGITSLSQCDTELRQTLLRHYYFAYQWISHRRSHAVAAEEYDKNLQGTESRREIRRVRSNDPYATPSLSFITFDQAQHDLGVKSRETWERERYSDLTTRFLPRESASQPKDKRLHRYAFGKNKRDKLFINKLLKDKGPQSYNWRIALSDLRKYSTPEEIYNLNDIDTSDHVPSLVPITGSHASEFNGSNEIQSLTRKVLSRSRNYRSFRLAHNISPPTIWSEANLAVYVEALAQSQRTQSEVNWAQKPRTKGWTNIGHVVAAFDQVFYSTTAQKFLSIEACNTALCFFYDHGMMAKARSLFIRMEDLKMRISTKTYNTLLRGSASQRDLHSFTFLLNNMTRRGFRPNEETWTLFLQVIDSSTVRAVIVRKMAEMNMLDNVGIRRDVAAHMVHYEITNHLGDGHDHHSFLDHMNSKYGVGWLSTSAGNKLLNEVAKRISAAESLDLLYEMKQAGFMPDDISMNTLLVHCSPLRRHELAIEILDAFKYHYRLSPGPATYETLFLQGWRSRLLNFSTVIWRSACIYGTVSQKMQDLVFQSLLSYTPALDTGIRSDDEVKSTNISRNMKFKKFAGRFVIGMDVPRGSELKQAKDTPELDPRRRRIDQAQALLQGSLHVSRECLLRSDFLQLLRQALTMDKTWAAEGLYAKDDWREMFPLAMAVVVKSKRRRQRVPRLRLRKLVVRGQYATRLLTRKRHSLRGPNRGISARLSTDQEHSENKRNPRAGPLVKGRHRTQPIRYTFISALSNSLRRCCTEKSPCYRLISQAIPRSRERRLENPLRTILGVSSSVSRPLLLVSDSNKERPTSLRPPRSVDRALVSSAGFSETQVRN